MVGLGYEDPIDDEEELNKFTNWYGYHLGQCIKKHGLSETKAVLAFLLRDDPIARGDNSFVWARDAIHSPAKLLVKSKDQPEKTYFEVLKHEGGKNRDDTQERIAGQILESDLDTIIQSHTGLKRADFASVGNGTGVHRHEQLYALKPSARERLHL